MKIKTWDVLFWIAMLILVGYIIAKLFGLINTLEWADLIPLITLVFLIGVFYQKVATFIDVMYKRTDYLKNNLDKINSKLIDHNKRLYKLEK
ncbi:MAG: hypothetical protein AABY22_11590 [Nanoarchaeota archaeon]